MIQRFLLLAGLALLTSWSKEAPPNIILLLADQWRAEAFGFEGNHEVRTPNFDRLAAESMRCVNAVSALPVCSPTRASLLTGLRPLTHGVFLNDVPLADKFPTLATVLKAAGYDTGYIGKWHLDGHGRSNFIPRERRHGFDYWKVLECTHAYTNSFYYGDLPEKLKWPDYDAIAQTRDACEFLRARSSAAKPFFLTLAWGPPHDPYFTAPAQYQAMYQADRLSLRPNVPAEQATQVRKILAGYYAHCTALDDCLALLEKTLSDTGLKQNTILVFSSDHGDMLGSHGMFKKQKPFDESVRVPMLWRWPRGLGSSRWDLSASFSTEDVMPTLLGLSGVKPPRMEGTDFSSAMIHRKQRRDDGAVIMCVAPFGEWERRVGGKEYRGIRTSDHTYVRDLSGPWLLFDHKRDPYQTNNLIALPEHAKVQRKMDQLLNRKLAAREDKFLPAQVYIDRWGYKVDRNGTVPYTP